MRDYQIASPSLEGVLNHSSILYDGIKRPLEILRIFDGPQTRSQIKNDKNLFDRKLAKDEQYILYDYFRDLHQVFLKKLSNFVVEDYSASDETIKLIAMLQEMIRVKRLIADKS